MSEIEFKVINRNLQQLNSGIIQKNETLIEGKYFEIYKAQSLDKQYLVKEFLKCQSYNVMDYFLKELQIYERIKEEHLEPPYFMNIIGYTNDFKICLIFDSFQAKCLSPLTSSDWLQNKQSGEDNLKLRLQMLCQLVQAYLKVTETFKSFPLSSFLSQQILAQQEEDNYQLQVIDFGTTEKKELETKQVFMQQLDYKQNALIQLENKQLCALILYLLQKRQNSFLSFKEINSAITKQEGFQLKIKDTSQREHKFNHLLSHIKEYLNNNRQLDLSYISQNLQQIQFLQWNNDKQIIQLVIDKIQSSSLLNLELSIMEEIQQIQVAKMIKHLQNIINRPLLKQEIKKYQKNEQIKELCKYADKAQVNYLQPLSVQYLSGRNAYPLIIQSISKSLMEIHLLSVPSNFNQLNQLEQVQQAKFLEINLFKDFSQIFQFPSKEVKQYFIPQKKLNIQSDEKNITEINEVLLKETCLMYNLLPLSLYLEDQQKIDFQFVENFLYEISYLSLLLFLNNQAVFPLNPEMMLVDQYFQVIKLQNKVIPLQAVNDEKSSILLLNYCIDHYQYLSTDQKQSMLSKKQVLWEWLTVYQIISLTLHLITKKTLDLVTPQKDFLKEIQNIALNAEWNKYQVMFFQILNKENNKSMLEEFCIKVDELRKEMKIQKQRQIYQLLLKHNKISKDITDQGRGNQNQKQNIIDTQNEEKSNKEIIKINHKDYSIIQDNQYSFYFSHKQQENVLRNLRNQTVDLTKGILQKMNLATKESLEQAQKNVDTKVFLKNFESFERNFNLIKRQEKYESTPNDIHRFFQLSIELSKRQRQIFKKFQFHHIKKLCQSLAIYYEREFGIRSMQNPMRYYLQQIAQDFQLNSIKFCAFAIFLKRFGFQLFNEENTLILPLCAFMAAQFFSSNELSVTQHQIFQEYINGIGFTYFYNNLVTYLDNQKVEYSIKTLDLANEYKALKSLQKESRQRRSKVETSIEVYENIQRLEKDIRAQCQYQQLEEQKEKQRSENKRFFLPEKFYQSKMIIAEEEKCNQFFLNNQVIEIVKAVYNDVKFRFVESQEEVAKMTSDQNSDELVDKYKLESFKKQIEIIVCYASDGLLPIQVQKQ